MLGHNLPFQPTTFVGRSDELTAIKHLLDDPNCRLLTLLGPGGIGKTRLSIEVAIEQLQKHRNGVYFVSLTPVGSPSLIVSAVANALQVSFDGAENPGSQIVRYLAEKQMLLIMDNFEHLLEGTELLITVLQAAPNVKFLVTSRERLNIQEEWVLALEGLSFPVGETHQRLETFSAVQLFVQRARQIQANFSLIENSDAVRRICQQVEGIPLAIELAATWLRAMSCHQITSHIATGLDFLSTPLRNVPERHRSLHVVFEQSWNQLQTTEQSVLMRLSVFRGGFDLSAAQHVAAASLILLASLADKSLIRLNTNGRYDLHELLRQYAAEKLREAGAADSAAQHHADYFLKLAEEAEAHMFGREQLSWFDRLETEFDNLRTALTWSLQSDNAETGLRLAAALGWLFSERIYWIEGLDWLERLLAANPNAPDSLRIKAYYSAGALAGLLDYEPHARALCGQALTLARVSNDRLNLAWSLCHMGNFIGDSNESVALLEESLAIFRELGNPMGIAHALGRRAWKAIQEQHDYDYGRALIEESAIIIYEFDDQILAAWLQYFLGLISCLQSNDFPQAKIHFESSMVIFREARCRFQEPRILLAHVEQAMGNIERAKLLYKETLISLQENSIIQFYLSWVLAGLAHLTKSLGQLERSAKLFGSANSIGITTPDITNLGTVTAAITAIRDQLGETAFAEAWTAGNTMTLTQIITYALGDSPAPIVEAETTNTTDRSQTQKPASQLLGDREQEILQLVADGLSNREIADRLVLALSTVKWYINEIFSKLHVSNRTQAVAQARALGLLS